MLVVIQKTCAKVQLGTCPPGDPSQMGRMTSLARLLQGLWGSLWTSSRPGEGAGLCRLPAGASAMEGHCSLQGASWTVGVAW